MKISKEVRIGLLATVSLLIFFIGYYFLKGANLFSNDKEYHCYYKNVEGLQNSASVQISGLNVGHVSEMHLVGEKGVDVVISVGKKIELPQGTIASLETFDLLGTKIIKLDLGPGPGMLANGAELTTSKEGGVVDNVSAELTPRLQEMKATIAALNITLANINKLVGEDNQKAIGTALQSIKLTADNLAQLTGTLNKESGEMSGIVHNANSITGNLAKNNDTINRILANFSHVSKQLDNAPIQKTFNELNSAAAQLQSVMDKINKGDGSLGMLVNDKGLYNNLNSSLNSINSLMTDIKAHPSRYINVTVFGKKN